MDASSEEQLNLEAIALDAYGAVGYFREVQDFYQVAPFSTPLLPEFTRLSDSAYELLTAEELPPLPAARAASSLENVAKSVSWLF